MLLLAFVSRDSRAPNPAETGHSFSTMVARIPGTTPLISASLPNVEAGGISVFGAFQAVLTLLGATRMSSPRPARRSE